jgi:hypothetical protein
MIHSDQHLNWLRSLKEGDLIGLSYYNGIQPGIIQRVLKGDCKVWTFQSNESPSYKTDIVENLPYEVDWIPVQEGQFERLVPYPKDFISDKTQLKLLIMLKKDYFK